jgi:hypothetical protein
MYCDVLSCGVDKPDSRVGSITRCRVYPLVDYMDFIVRFTGQNREVRLWKKEGESLSLSP